MFGIQAATHSGAAEDFYRFVYPEDRERVRKAVADALQSRTPYRAGISHRPHRRSGAMGHSDGKILLRKEWRPRANAGHGSGHYRPEAGGTGITCKRGPISGHHRIRDGCDHCRRRGVADRVVQRLPRRRCSAAPRMKPLVRFSIVLFPNATARCTKHTCAASPSPELPLVPWKRRSGLWAVRTNGQEFPMEASITHLESGGRSLFTVTLRDITERRLAEEAIRESEQRFRLVANTAPVMIWMSGPDKLCNYFNKTWLEFSGRPLEAELGDGWSEGVHPEDLKACRDIYIRAFDRRESFSMQYRLRRYDGEYRWVIDTGVPRSNPDGSFEGYIGSCIDVTDRKLAEEALARMGRRLIEAHEQERTWIARELHDDVLQRMALLMIDLEVWGQQLPDSAGRFPRAHAPRPPASFGYRRRHSGPVTPPPFFKTRISGHCGGSQEFLPGVNGATEGQGRASATPTYRTVCPRKSRSVSFGCYRKPCRMR